MDEALASIHTAIVVAMKSQTMTLCHNDFQASNIIYNEKTNQLGVIDFGNSTVFTPTLDIATHLTHLTVMTTQHLKQDEIVSLQKQFITAYLDRSPEPIARQVLSELPLYIARVAADIVATTAVALMHTENPYRILIPQILLPVIQEKRTLIGNESITIDDCLITLKR